MVSKELVRLPGGPDPQVERLLIDDLVELLFLNGGGRDHRREVIMSRL
jgi:hypothetical protein